MLSSFLRCTSFVIAGRLGIQDVFSFDADFAAIGFRVWPQQGDNGEGRDLTA
jgi:predicted nucleic acid-binding protein